MGLFTTSKEEYEDLRGVRDYQLQSLNDLKLLMLAMSVLLGSVGCDDEELINELIRRARKP